MCGCIGNCILARAPIRPNSAWKALGVIGPSRSLRRLQREQALSSHVFMTERDGPMTPKAFHALFGRIGAWAKMEFPIHPHMLRHGCGYALANAGHDTRALQAWLGHKKHSTHRALYRAKPGPV